MGQRYSPSNKFNPILVTIFFVVANSLSFIITGTAALLGLWLVRPYAGMVLVFIASWGVYWLQLQNIKYSKNRNIKLARAIIFISSLLISFFHMAAVFSMTNLLGEALLTVELSLTFKDIRDVFIASLGLFKFPGEVLNSFFKSGLSWILYFIVILFSNIVVPQFAAEQSKVPFSEEYNAWMTEVYSLGKLDPFPDREQHLIVSALRRQDLIPFVEQPRCTTNDPVDYAVILFLKVGNAHSGFVGVQHFHQKRTSSGEFIPNKYQMIEFIPPIQIGAALSLKLENILNSTAMSGHREYLQQVRNAHGNDEFGYKLYRTSAEAADYDNLHDYIQQKRIYDTQQLNSSMHEQQRRNNHYANLSDSYRYDPPYVPNIPNYNTGDYYTGSVQSPSNNQYNTVAPQNLSNSQYNTSNAQNISNNQYSTGSVQSINRNTSNIQISRQNQYNTGNVDASYNNYNTGNIQPYNQDPYQSQEYTVPKSNPTENYDPWNDSTKIQTNLPNSSPRHIRDRWGKSANDDNNW